MPVAPDRIVVPLDGSQRAERAVPLAGYIGWILGAHIELITVSDDEGMTFDELPKELRRSIAATTEYLKTWVKSVKVHVLHGDPATTIGQYSAGRKTLLILATHEGMGVLRKTESSVAEDLLETTNTPVLLIRSNDTPANMQVAARIFSLLIPLDGKPGRHKSLEFGHLLAERLSAPITLLDFDNDSDSITEMETESRIVVNQASTVINISSSRTMGKTIVNQAHSMDSPLIILSSDRSGVSTGLLESAVTDFVVRHSKYPILVIPQSKSLA